MGSHNNIRVFLSCAFFVLMIAVINITAIGQSLPSEFTITKAQLRDKIKGGWAGQTIGVTYGGPTEFKYLGRIIDDFVELPWREEYIKEFFEQQPGLYDDIYMDLSFVDVIERLGVDAPVDSFASSFANAEFRLWHANQAARYNILNGIMPPASGHWKNNLHSDCIDFQIEADFAGLMSPGMPNTSSVICDKVGHIMNHGDGWYGGVYVASMYALAFVSDDIEFIVREALKSIPAESNYYECMNQVLGWYEEYPDDWKKAWFEIERANWKESCPKGIHRAFNIEATVNSAYVLLGLLYGKGDFKETMEISTRSGQDSDCNPATCAGILGVIMGYDKIPAYWINPLKKVEDIDFDHTTMSLNDTYEVGLKHALQMVEANGGKIIGDQVTIKVQSPEPVRLEQSPDYFKKKKVLGNPPLSILEVGQGVSINEFGSFEFEGVGMAVNGAVEGNEKNNPDYIASVEFIIDGKTIKTMELPLDFITRSVDLFWVHGLPKGKHNLQVKWLNPKEDIDIVFESVVIYNEEPISNSSIKY